jgi:predicted AAA+ superfamily ATPase
VRQLQPWHENLSKRQVRSPRIFIADSGLLHALLNIRTRRDLLSHPKVGASWEGFVIEQVTRTIGAGPEECFFWSTYSGAELDLLVVRGTQKLGFEIKRTTAPTVTRSMKIAMEDLGLSRLTVVHAGDRSFSLGPRMAAVPLGRVLDDLPKLRG